LVPIDTTCGRFVLLFRLFGPRLNPPGPPRHTPIFFLNSPYFSGKFFRFPPAILLPSSATSSKRPLGSAQALLPVTTPRVHLLPFVTLRQIFVTILESSHSVGFSFLVVEPNLAERCQSTPPRVAARVSLVFATPPRLVPTLPVRFVIPPLSSGWGHLLLLPIEGCCFLLWSVDPSSASLVLAR